MASKGVLNFDPISAYWSEVATSWEDLIPGYDDDDTRLARSQQASEVMMGSLLPHQEDFVGDRTTRHLGLVAGFGCLGGETLINGVPIRDLCDQPMVVPTMFGPAAASAAYRKGRAALYWVETAGGRRFRATTDHRCLTPDGWVEVGRLAKGTLLAVDEKCCELFGWDAVEKVEFDCEDDYYDLHVPVWNHYVANGVVHHNSGKSHSLVVKALQLCYDNPGFTGILMEPSFGMLRDIIVPLVDQLWTDWGVQFTYRKSPEPELNVVCPNGEISTVLLRSFENVARIRGINAAWALVDEIDTVKPDTAEYAFNLLLGRIRTGILPQIAVASTPEGFGFCYNFFVERDDDSKRLIKAKTTDNIYLPESYIDGLRGQYPPNLLAAYLNGEFVNLASTTVFSEYDRMRHNTAVLKPEPDEAVYVGCDFNVNQCHQVYGVLRQERGMTVMHIFKQTVTKTTYELADLLQRLFPNQAVQRKIYVAPDAAGGAAHSSSTQTDHQILAAKHYRLICGRSNPGVFDSLAHTNSLFHQDRVRINFSACPGLANACERWALDSKGAPIKGGSNDYSHEGDCLRYLSYWGQNGAHRTMSAGPRTY